MLGTLTIDAAHMQKTRAIKLTVAVAIFGVLAAIAPSFSETWKRILIGCCAGAVFGVILIIAQSKSTQGKFRQK